MAGCHGKSRVPTAQQRRGRSACPNRRALGRRPITHRRRRASRRLTHDDTSTEGAHFMPPIIEARGLLKRYGKVRALDGLDLVAESGHVTALLGPNGAGKTTFVSAVATLLRPDGGEVRVAGIDAATEPKRVREIIGLAGQSASVEAWGRVW